MLTPYKYQQDIINSESHKDSHALFVGMGLGKTLLSLELMKLKPIKKLLIICLKSKRHEWQEDALSQNNLNLVILDKGTKKNISLLESDCDGFVVNFESVWRLDTTLLDIVDESWGIIVDESHNIKNPRSKVTRFHMKLGNRTKYKTILTGTPQSDGYIDYLTQMNFLGKWNMTRNEFENKYCVMVKSTWLPYDAYEIGSYKNTNELTERLTSDCVYFERTPEYSVTNIDVELPNFPAYRKWMKDKVFTWKVKGETFRYLGDSSGSYRMGLRTFASGHLGGYARDSEKLEWVRDLFNSYDKRIVIFYNFNKERDDLVKLCESVGIPYSEYSGRTKDLDNFKNLERSVVLCNYGSASTGINDLVIASVCVMYSPTDNYITFEQAKKRIDRLGQKGNPIIYYLRVKGTVEVAIYRALKEGLDFDDKMFDKYLELC